MDRQRAAAVRVLGVVEVAAQLVGLQLAEVLLLRKLHLQAGQLLVLPADDDVFGARLIGRAHAGVGKIRHRDGAAQNHRLARADVYAHLDDEIGIKLQKFLVHGWFSF